MNISSYLYSKKLSNLFGQSKDDVKNKLISQSETLRLNKVFLEYRDKFKKQKECFYSKETFYNYLKFFLNELEDNILLFYIEGAMDFGALPIDKTKFFEKIEELININEGIFAVSSQDGKGGILVEINQSDSDLLFYTEIEGKWANERINFD